MVAALATQQTGTTMKALVQEGTGSADVLHLRDIERPAITDDRVLIRVRAASVNALDWHNVHGGRALTIIGKLMRQPNIPVRGVDVAGEIEAVGKNVTRLRPGDVVFGTGRATFAEYATSTERVLVTKPPQLSFAQAACFGVAAVTALQGLRDRGQLTAGQRVLVYGAGGGVGTFAVQIAKALGARVTAVTSTHNLELVRSMNPDLLIDYSTEDFTRRPERYDLVADVAGDRSFGDMRRVLTPNGRIVLIGAAKKSWFAVFARLGTSLLRSRLGSKWLVLHMAAITNEDLVALKGMVEAGKLMPVIDRQYPLSEAAEAVRYVGTGKARAKVVITVP
ncbi:MAG TPA: NAD(P)-dependent alcohol dehydrogenase [Candidatus Limnocylindria bacterium]